MTIETGIDPYRDAFAGMAITAAGGVRLMQNVTDQGRIFTAVGAMTGPAALKFAGIIGVLSFERLERVTGQTEFRRFFEQQTSIVRLVRRMTGGTLTLCVGLMGKLELLGQARMAGKTGHCGLRFEQPGLVRRMGIMAGKAFPLAYRLVHYGLLQYCIMAGIAQPGNLPLDQPFVWSDMGVMAGETFTIRHRLMLHLPLKRISVVTGKTVNGGQRLTLSGQQQQQDNREDNSTKTM